MRAAAGRRLARAEAVAALQLIGRRVDNPDPSGLLLAELVESAGSVRALRERLAQVDAAQLVEGDGRVWLDLYLTSQERVMRFADLGARLGIEQRRTALAEALAGLVANLIRQVLTPGLTPDQNAAAMAALPPAVAELRAQLDTPGRT